MTLTYGSLFSGIDGLGLGLDRSGMTKRWQSEIDPYCCRVLAKHWPHVPNLGDVTTIDWSTVEHVDLICGGYPCQPFSFAGARQGERDPRHLWPRFREALCSLRPRWALLENVPGHLSLGFGRVQGDLAALGYDTQWDCLPAAAVGAPHLRYRIFVVAHANGEGQPELAGHAREIPRVVVPDADTERWDGRPGLVGQGRGGESTDGSWWATEPDVGRVAHGVPHRVERLRALGNAVVPQVAEWIGRRIMEAAA